MCDLEVGEGRKVRGWFVELLAERKGGQRSGIAGNCLVEIMSKNELHEIRRKLNLHVKLVSESEVREGVREVRQGLVKRVAE